ncbi:MAG: Type 1 glutamine amidotransferase-like domain-containing protein [Pontiellaceae bacterium]|nr:Type 1 glutamine amidotransferase-like domain-containing protein [Pontiellaceae bacterium]
MKRLFLASHFSAVAKRVPGFLDETYAGKTVTFIPTAGNVEKVDFFVASAKKAFKKLGLLVDELDVSRASREAIESKLRNNAYIYVSGGNTFYLLQELKHSGADRIIIEEVAAGKPYIGESAGSIIASPDIEYAHLLDDRAKAERLEDDSALELVEFYPLPHHGNFPFKKAVEATICRYDSKIDLRPINNKQVITVLGDTVTIG